MPMCFAIVSLATFVATVLMKSKVITNPLDARTVFVFPKHFSPECFLEIRARPS